MLHFKEDVSSKNDFIDLRVVLNLDCNFACRYCFEEAVKRSQYMSSGKIEAVNCQKQALDANLEALIRQDLKYRPVAL